MKRYLQPEKTYLFGIGMGTLLGIAICMLFITSIGYKATDYCTPSENTQQILSAISGTQLSMEMLITESLEFNCKK